MRTTAWLMMFALVACNGDDSSASADGSASDDGTSSLGTSSATTQAATDSRAGTDDAGSQSTSESTTSDSGHASTGGFKFDLATQPDAPVGECDCGTASSYSYIWVANSPDSTVSKINTQSVTEEGRYLTRADVNGNPSRTSVSISGEAVAVANRHGGLIKIFANEANCVEKNGTPGIQTSTGAGDVLAWDEDECVHWYRDFPDWTVQRPVAWAPGTFNEVTCQWENEQVWTAGCGGGGSPGFGGDATTHVHLLDGETGDDVMTVDVTGYSCSGFGPYGGAVDSEGNFWLVQNNGSLAFIERSTGNFEIHEKDPDTAPYGLTVDSLGRPWVTSYSSIGVARFDPTTLTWALVTDPVVASIGQSGIAQGGDGRIWVAGTIDGAAGVAGIDPETLDVVDILHGQSQGKGVSVDAAGYVWRAGGSMATRFDADDGTSTNYMGLNAAYTYSDMTGLGVANAVGCNPAG